MLKEVSMTKTSVAGLWQIAKLNEKLVIIVGLLYILSPIDILPEVILGPLGIVDDGGALLAVIYALTNVLKRQRQTRSNVIDVEEVSKDN
jgi:uncharacterized membrane protein YkvA (DUF1232 family)